MKNYVFIHRQDLFLHFLRQNYPSILSNMTEGELIKVSNKFGEYLLTHLSIDDINRIIPKNEADIIHNLKNSNYINGFHSDYHTHFSKYLAQLYKG